jgi:hypothetical protein
MVADGVLRRIAQHNRPLVPSRAVLIPEPYSSPQVEREEVVLDVEK